MAWSRRQWFITILSVVLFFVGLRRVGPTLRRMHWRLDWSWYDMGWPGKAPTRQYHSFNHSSIDVRFSRRDPRCSKDQIFLATRGPTTETGAFILDHTGELQWMLPQLAPEVHDFRVQEYRGEKWLTFWAGSAGQGGKIGSWIMMDDTYTARRRIIAHGFKHGDMHEFLLTDQGTALLTIYNPIQMDLSPIGGPEDGYALDGVFQEIDIESGEILFQWNAAAHIPASACRRDFKGCSDDPHKAFAGCGNTREAAFDYYHINSVQKDPLGNYLVSGRHTSSLTYIDGQSGEVLWHMGGPLNQFKYLPEGTERLFTWQHDARLHNDSTITVLDNNAINNRGPHKQSRALRLQFDAAQKTVSVQQAFLHPQERMSYSQGNVQVLEDSGNVQVGWGNCAALTEFAHDGEMLCDARFAPATFFPLQPISSYRAYRSTWVGKPKTLPSAVVYKGRIYVSWNGATEVASWRVEGSLDGEQFSNALEVPRMEFETKIRGTFGHYKSVRIAALDKDGHVLGTSDSLIPPHWLGRLFALASPALAAASIVAGSGIFVYIVSACLRRRQHRKHMEMGYKPVDTID